MDEQKIIEYIKKEYNPEAILLGGSRSKGKETSNSDWDLFLLGSKKNKGGFVKFDNELLDITFKNWPEDNKALTIPSGPLWPIRILFDTSDNKLSELLAKTKEDFEKGPMVLYEGPVLERFEKLDSWRRKIEKYQNNPMVEFFYAGVFYEFAIRSWFELQNKWSLAPAEALYLIREQDKNFYDLLDSYIISISSERLKFVNSIFEKLEQLKNPSPQD